MQLRSRICRETGGEPVQRQNCGGLLDARPLGVGEPLPDHHHREAEENRVDHAERRELEPRHLIVGRDALESDELPHQDRTAHRNERRDENDQDRRFP